MSYTVKLTRQTYQYKISLPTALIKSLGWDRVKSVVLEKQDDGKLLIFKTERKSTYERRNQND